MISINLLPPEFRKEKKSHLALSRKRRMAEVGGICFGVLTFIFYLQYQLSLKSLRELQGRWLSLDQEVRRVTQLQKGIEEGIQKEGEFLERYVTSPFPTTAILNAVSHFLPDSIWLLELKVSRQPKGNTFLLKGLSLPSERYSSVQDIETYLRELKEKFPPRTDLMLTTSRQLTENRELTLFTVVFKWS